MGGPVETFPTASPLPMTRVTPPKSLTDKTADTALATVSANGVVGLAGNLTEDWAGGLIVGVDTAADVIRRCDLSIGKKCPSFYEALAAAGAGHEDIVKLVRTAKPFRNLSKVKRGDTFWAELHSDGGIRLLGFDLDEESYVEYVRVGDDYEMRQGAYPVEHRITGVSGVISHSLYQSLGRQDAPLTLAAKLNDILGWEIDFGRDLRKGDTYRLIYEEIWRDGEFLRTGPILAAEYVNRNNIHRAYRFAMPDGRPGYYNDDGQNFQKQLMRAPLEYSRISSGFSYRRFHPVLKRWMPHMGVDYAAPVGTPVRAAGDGTIVERGRKRGNGRYIKIRHTNRDYETYYLHLSRFHKRSTRGRHVRQGDVIGYVGATGYATGPHLDYRVKRNGSWVNPRRLKLPAAAPVAEQDLADFARINELLGRSLAALPDETTPTAVDGIETSAPPRWNASRYLAAMIPETLRPL